MEITNLVILQSEMANAFEQIDNMRKQMFLTMDNIQKHEFNLAKISWMQVNELLKHVQESILTIERKSAMLDRQKEEIENAK